MFISREPVNSEDVGVGQSSFWSRSDTITSGGMEDWGLVIEQRSSHYGVASQFQNGWDWEILVCSGMKNV